jgi:hypothetical protein
MEYFLEDTLFSMANPVIFAPNQRTGPAGRSLCDAVMEQVTVLKFSSSWKVCLFLVVLDASQSGINFTLHREAMQHLAATLGETRVELSGSEHLV